MFVLFAGDNYYPLGGWRDWAGTFPSKEEAVTWAAQTRRDWWHVLDVKRGSIVASSSDVIFVSSACVGCQKRLYCSK
jgi:hypothetical protein